MSPSGSYKAFSRQPNKKQSGPICVDTMLRGNSREPFLVQYSLPKIGDPTTTLVPIGLSLTVGAIPVARLFRCTNIVAKAKTSPTPYALRFTLKNTGLGFT